MVREFREFILRGNLVDLAVAFVLGAAFSALVTSFVKNLITPLIALIGGKPDFSGLAFSIGGTNFTYGAFLTSLISFLIIAAVVFFFVVRPANELMSRFGPKEEKDTRECPECLSGIPQKATRCAFCTAEVGPAAAGGGVG